MPLLAGTRLGPYEISAPLGAGGMGEVYRAHDTRLNRDVALKILPADLANDPSRRQRFELEARAVAALSHPNIVAIYDVGRQADVSYIVTELVDGEPLRGVKPSLRKTIDIATQIAAGLAAAHDAGIVHRDLKPENVLLTRDGRVKILDFGLARVTTTTAAAATETVTVRTEPGAVMGTVGYMSPEQIRGAAVDPRSDIFNLGLILHEMLTGARTFHGETSVETMTAILKQDAPELPETVPAGVRAIASRCLEKDPVNRFQSARDLAFALSQPLSGSHATAAVASARRPRWSMLATVAVALAVGFAAALFWFRPPAPQTWTGILLNGSDRSQSPTPSPDGHTIAFIVVEGEFMQVGVMKPESGNQAILTHSTDKGYIDAVAWSPDGTKLYYDRITDVPRGIYSVPVLGGPEQLVLEDAMYPEPLPDGSLLISRYNSDRQLQLHRFWPETGRTQSFPIQLSTESILLPRAFPDGKRAVAIGSLIGPHPEPGPHLYKIDLETGKVGRLLPPTQNDANFGAMAITRDGKSILAVRENGNGETVQSISADGRIIIPNLLTLTNGVYTLAPGADGSIYLDQVDRPAELLRFPLSGGAAERIATLPNYEAPGAAWGDDEAFAILPDGRAIVAEGTGGHLHLMVLEAGKDSAPLINTTEETSAPVTAAGPANVAFVIGPRQHRSIAVAAVANGRILRRIEFDKGTISSLAASPDGQTLYCAAGGKVWSLSPAGESKLVRAGDHVAVDPAGRYLVVEVTESPVIRLFRVPLDGGPEQEITRTGPERPAYYLGPNGVSKDGRVVMPIGSATWYWPAGVLDPSTGKFARIPVDRVLDYHAVGWTPDGKIMGVALGWKSRMWKFAPEKK